MDTNESNDLTKPEVIRPGLSSIHVVYQLLADVSIPQEATPEEVFAESARIVLAWAEKKLPQPLPAPARQLECFDMDLHGQQQANGIAIPEDGLWCFRLVQPDAPFMEREAVPGRTWTTDISLQKWNDRVRLGVNVLCVSTEYAQGPIPLMRPHFLLDLSERYDLHETLPMDGKPWMLENEEELQLLYDRLLSSGRSFPIIVLTQLDPEQWPTIDPGYVIDENELAKATHGFAHVVCLPSSLEQAWATKVGLPWSVSKGAVRLYWPKLDFQHDHPSKHTLAVPNGFFNLPNNPTIHRWRYSGQKTGSKFFALLVDEMKRHASKKYVDWGDCLFYPEARSRLAALNRERLRSAAVAQGGEDEVKRLWQRIAEMEVSHAEEITALQAELKESKDYEAMYEEEAASCRIRADQKERENFDLTSKVAALQAALEAVGQTPEPDIPIPDNYFVMSDWVKKHLKGRLIFHSRAVQSSKTGVYEDIGLVYESLLLLAKAYRDMRLGQKDAKEEWDRELRRLGLECSGSISKSRAGQEGDTYFVQYPPGATQWKFLELHLKKGSTKDDRFCLRIYFFWDDDTQQVVVGWLPSHLETRAT